MFDYPLNSTQNTYILDHHCSENVHGRRYTTALNQFRASLLKGKLFRLQTKALRRPLFLVDLNAIKSGLRLRGSCYAGTKVVRIDAIIGSEGRTSDFDRKFHPVSEEARERWVSVATAYLARLPLPPVELIQIGNAYFVRDGHHRISVSRAFGQVAIDAEVTTWNAASPFPWQSTTEHDDLSLAEACC